MLCSKVGTFHKNELPDIEYGKPNHFGVFDQL
jgi:hypothetical protein